MCICFNNLMPAKDPAHRRVSIGVEMRFIGMAAAKPDCESDVNLFFGELLSENIKLKAANEILRKENAKLRKGDANGSS